MHPTDEEDEQGLPEAEEVDVEFEPDAELVGAVSGSEKGDRENAGENRDREGGRREKRR